MDHSEVKHFPKVDHTPAELDEASKLLLKAAAKLERDGWCQGALEYGGKHCLIGALHWADKGSVNSFYSKDGAQAWERVRGGLGGLEAVEWNNAEGRTAGEVIAKLRAVALGL